MTTVGKMQALYSVYSDEREYQKDITEQIQNRYEEYFRGQHLKFNGISVEYSDNIADLWETTIVVTMDFSADNATYYGMCLRKNARGKFNVYDVFLDTTDTEVTYVYEGEGETDLEEEEEENEDVSKELDNNKDSLFYHLIDKDQEMTFWAMRYKIALKYSRLLEGEKDALSSPFDGGFQYEGETKEEQETRTAKWEKELEILTQKKYYLKRMNMNVKTYDREKHYFIYQVVFEIEDQNSKESVYLSVDAYRWRWGFILLPDSERLLGEVSDPEAKEIMENFFR